MTLPFKDSDIYMEGRNQAIKYIKENNLCSDHHDIYLFGVYSGVSSKLISNKLINDDISYHRIYGFDSFRGLPTEKLLVKKYEGHQKGAFNAMELFGTEDIQEIIQNILKEIGNEKFEIIQGLFKEVLSPVLHKEKKFHPASFIDIDVDLYRSTIDVFRFLFKYNLILPGTVIYFDDWGGVEEYTGGESLAWKHLVKDYSIKYDTVFSHRADIHAQKVFVIKE